MSDFQWNASGIDGGTLDEVAFNLLKAKLDHQHDAFRRYALNADLFRDGVGLPPPRPLTRRERWRNRWGRVRTYCATLWLALKGHDPYEDEGDW